MKKIIDVNDFVPIIAAAVENGKTVKFTIKGNSMYPLLMDGRDRAVVAAPGKLKKYDVILYRRNNGKYIFHRIIKINTKDNLLQLCGDNEDSIEENVRFSDVVAKAVGFERKGISFSTKNILYKIYSFLWCISLKIRRPVIKVAAVIYKLLKK